MDATFTSFGIDATYTPAGGSEVWASEIADPCSGDQLTVDGETFVIQGEPERRDPDRLLWTIDVGPA